MRMLVEQSFVMVCVGLQDRPTGCSKRTEPWSVKEERQSRPMTLSECESCLPKCKRNAGPLANQVSISRMGKWAAQNSGGVCMNSHYNASTQHNRTSMNL